MSVTLSLISIRIFFLFFFSGLLCPVFGQQLFFMQKDTLVHPNGTTTFLDSIGSMNMSDCMIEWKTSFQDFPLVNQPVAAGDISFSKSGELVFLSPDMNTINGLAGHCFTKVDTTSWEGYEAINCFGSVNASNFVFETDSTLYLGAFTLKHYNIESGSLIDMGYIGVGGELLDYISAITIYNDEIFVFGRRFADIPFI